MKSLSTIGAMGHEAGSRLDVSDRALPDEILAILGQDDGLLILSRSQGLDRSYMIHAGAFQYQLDPQESMDFLDLPIELLGEADPSRGPCMLGPAGKYRVGWNLEDQWRITDTATGFVEIDASSSAIEFAHSADGELRIPVKPQSDYVFSGYFAVHRARARVVLRFCAADGRILDSVERAISPDYPGGREAVFYHHVELAVTAPPGARHALLLLAYDGTHLPVQNFAGYIFFAGMSLRRTQPEMACTIIASQPRAKLIEVGRCRTYKATIDFVAITQARGNLEITNGTSAYKFYSLQEPVAVGHAMQLNGNTVSVGLMGGAATRLYIDNAFCSTRIPAGDESGHRFVIPGRHFDGAMHYLQVRDAYGIGVLAQDVHVFPASLTTWESLQKDSTPPLPNHMAPQAAYRYRSLQAHLADPRLHSDKWLLENLMTLHGVLERGFDGVRSLAPLRIHEHPEPLVSIVIPAKDKVEVSYFCLCALIFAHSRVTFEVILVDDGSADATKELPQIVEGLRYVRNEASLGFVQACNRGAELARGEFIVFLNNDTEVTTGWLDELVDAFANHHPVGMAGSRLIYPNGLQQEAGGIVWGTGNPWNYGRMANPADPRFSYVRQVDYVSGAALMVSRSAWEAVGGFSEDYAPAYFEDTDLAFKVREQGLKTIYVPHSVVYHYEGMSSGTDTDSGMKRFQEVNRPKFKRKWAQAFRGHGKEGHDVDLEKDRGINGRALFIDAATPRPDFDAGSYAAIQEMLLVQALGYKVTFVAQNAAYLGRYTEDLQRRGIEVLYAPFYFSVGDVLDKRGEEFDLVYITRYQVAAQHIDSVRRHAPRAKILFCNADLHFLRELRAAVRANDSVGIDKALEVREQELAVMQRVDLTLSYNDVEHAVIFSHNSASSNVRKCPWVVANPPAVVPYKERAGIAFLGGYGHPPNIEAVETFARVVMPVLRQSANGIVFHVYGSQAPASLKALEAPDVLIHGFVADVAEVYDSHRVFVAPLLSGAGIKGKVIGAMAHGIPCVLSPIAAEGIGARDGRECIIADKPEEWVEAIVRLHDDAKLWATMSANARDLVAEEYSFEAGLKHMRSALEAVDLY